eukprot:jgi/Mesen1/10176/ME000076S09684
MALTCHLIKPSCILKLHPRTLSSLPRLECTSPSLRLEQSFNLSNLFHARPKDRHWNAKHALSSSKRVPLGIGHAVSKKLISQKPHSLSVRPQSDQSRVTYRCFDEGKVANHVTDFQPDAIMVLAGGQTEDGGVPVWVQKRLDVALSLHRKYGCPIVCLGGGTPHRPPVIGPAGHVIHEGTSCADYLLSKGMAAPSILKEWGSYDTIGNGYFALVWHSLPRQWRALAVITSEFHMPRSRMIFDWIFGLQGADLRPRDVGDYSSRQVVTGGSAGVGAGGVARGQRDSLATVPGGSSCLNASSSISASNGTNLGNGHVSSLLAEGGHSQGVLGVAEEEEMEVGLRVHDIVKGGASRERRGEVPSELNELNALNGLGEQDEDGWVLESLPRDRCPARQGYRIVYYSVSDDGIDPALIQARILKEQQSMENLRRLIVRLHSLPDFHIWFHTEHKAYNVADQHKFGVSNMKEVKDPTLLCY